MGKEFEERSLSGIKVGDDQCDAPKTVAHEYSSVEMTDTKDDIEDTSCGVEEEGQSPTSTKKKGVISAMV